MAAHADAAAGVVRAIKTNQIELALKGLITEAMTKAYGAVLGAPVPEPIVQAGKKADFQCPNAMALTKMLGQKKVKAVPVDVANELVKNIPANDLLDASSVSEQGFINFSVNAKWLAKAVSWTLEQGVQPPEVKKEKVLVDFSSPNIAKEMHVGHLRSTIIGESICRMMEFVGHDVARINHVGDWGTQFGMLILHMKQKFPDFLTKPPPISDLVVFYKEAKARFDAEPDFKEQARLEVVKLQSKQNADSTAAWQMICDLSRKEFQEIYDRLGIKLEERGESFYNDIIPDVLAKLTAAGAMEKSDGADIIICRTPKAQKDIDKKDVPKLLGYFVTAKRDGSLDIVPKFKEAATEAKIFGTNEKEEEVVHLAAGGKETKPLAKFDAGRDLEKLAKMCDGLFRPKLNPKIEEALQAMKMLNDKNEVLVPRFTFPLIAKKSDGGYTYDSTDLAAIYHRFQVDKFDRVVYVTDVGQFDHFNMVAQVAQDVAWLGPNQRWAHAGFGLVSGEDGKKLKTRSGDTVKLKDLLDEACTRAETIIRDREADEGTKQGFTDEEITTLSKKIGFGAVQYFDLKQNRETDYAFSYDKMLDQRGNTAVYLLYTYARIASIKRKAGVSDIAALAKEVAAAGGVQMEHESERLLVLAAMNFATVLARTLEDLYPHHITDFCYDLVGAYSNFYRDCRVVGHPLEKSRLLVVEMVGRTLQQALQLLGIEVNDRM